MVAFKLTKKKPLAFSSQRFHFHEQDISIFHKLSITTKYYETNVLIKSAKTPHILMFYSDWCFSCMKSAGAFKKLIDTLEPLGIVFGAINIGHENHLTRKIGIHSLPCMSLVLDGHNYIYKDNIYSVQKVVGK
jgi:DnaJ homolog subfamily C member 16